MRVYMRGFSNNFLGTKEHQISYLRKEIKQMVYLFVLYKWRFFVKSKNQDLEVGISAFKCLKKKIFKKN